MSSKPRNRVITTADLAAARRLKELWLSRAKPLGVTQETVAELLDGTQGLVSQYMTGKIALNYRALLAFAQALQLEDPSVIRADLPEQQLAGRVLEPQLEYSDWADVRGYAQATGLGAGAEADEYAESHKLKFRAASLRRKGLRPQHLVVYYGKGDSMEPRIHDGDAILFDTSDTTPKDGAVFIVQRGKEMYAKRCEVLDGVAYFRSDNPHGDHHWRKAKRMDNPRDPLQILGRVRWIGSWED